MLPDYPKLKADLNDWCNEFIRSRVRQLSPVTSTFRHHRVFEGEATHLVRADGTQHATDFSELQAHFEVRLADIPSMTFAQLIERLEGIAESLARQQAKGAYAELERAVEEVGNVLDSRGTPLSAEALLEIFQKIDISFDDHGRMSGLTIVAHPNQADRIAELFRALEADPLLKRRWDEVIGEKREQWRAREADRRLVG